MNAENKKAENLWDRILASIASKVPAGCYDTWFRPLKALSLNGSELEVIFPNETFRASFIKSHLDLLREIAIEVADAGIEFCFSVQQESSKEDEACNLQAQPLPVVRASDITTADCQQSWLIERLWVDQAVGIIGGSPKSGKTWLALEIAVSVASGRSCLGTFAVCSPGPVLLYAAEDSASAIRIRLETLAQLHKISLAQLDVHIITVDSLRLDRPEDQDRLEATLYLYKPSLLVLDPLVRVHAIDENVAGQVAALLGYLRSLQRKTGAAVVLVHHVRKNISSAGSAGYSLRGSGDLYAWLDSFLYLRLHQGQRTLSAEHRSAPPFGPITLDLVEADPIGPYLKITSSENPPCKPPQEELSSRILKLLSDSPRPLTIETLRSRLQVRNQRVVETLHSLAAQGKVQRLARGFAASHQSSLSIKMFM
ncbi:MAG: AAA family ATPase [Candidatus Promineifilaceae bacterium]|jgi:hypothetical protein